MLPRAKDRVTMTEAKCGGILKALRCARLLPSSLSRTLAMKMSRASLTPGISGSEVAAKSDLSIQDLVRYRQAGTPTSNPIKLGRRSEMPRPKRNKRRKSNNSWR